MKIFLGTIATIVLALGVWAVINLSTGSFWVMLLTGLLTLSTAVEFLKMSERGYPKKTVYIALNILYALTIFVVFSLSF